MKPSFTFSKAMDFRLTIISLTGALTFLFSSPGFSSQNYEVTDFDNMPVSIVSEGVTPRVTIAASNDHQLYFKAYNDYSDLNDDGIPDTTYDHTIDYYGYFDGDKCYTYSASNTFAGGNTTTGTVTTNTAGYFTPNEFAYSLTDTTNSLYRYCNLNSSGVHDSSKKQWSGNFLNWVSMARIDTIRKVLFGGHRRVDSSTTTILERTYLPHDAHSWAKHYTGSDIKYLTPFTLSPDDTPDQYEYYCDDDNLSNCGGTKNSVNLGITLGNTTDITLSNYDSKDASEDYLDPPLIKVVRGDYSLWASNERWQVTWASGSSIENHGASNKNNSSNSGIYSNSDSPSISAGLGQKNYIARVQACVAGLIGDEKCDQYPGADGILTSPYDSTSDDVYKPVGLLHEYGQDKMMFSMVAGSYQDHTSGGELMRNSGFLTDEINFNTDGTFPLVGTFAGGPAGNSAEGIINNWSLYRIYGYSVQTSDAGTYNQADSCSWGLSDPDDVTGNECHNWGNPFSEIYWQALRYLAGEQPAGSDRTNDSGYISGLPQPLAWDDPIDEASYCADLFIINFNSSATSYDYDDIDNNANPVTDVFDEDDLPSGNPNSIGMTKVVGDYEGITNNAFFVGQANVPTSSLGNNGENQLCTSKTVTNFGLVGGTCPEAPRLNGSYRIAGLAYYAHVRDMRADLPGNDNIPGMQTVDTFSVALSSGAPSISIPTPGNPDTPLVTILPACRNQTLSPEANCALVDFKIVKQDLFDSDSNKATGKYYINWEDSEQGGDYDQDMWGILEVELDRSANTIKVKSQVFAQSTGDKLAFGYVIDGTTSDGFHAHSGINGFKWKTTYGTSDKADSGNYDCTDSDGCVCRGSSEGACTETQALTASTKTYTLGTSTTKLLEDPLWYAAKYGGFIDSNENNLPDIHSEWDSKDNDTGEVVYDADGNIIGDDVPDNYFYASNPRKLESNLKRVLDAILERTSSGTAAAVVSSNVSGEGAMYQAYYEPLKKDSDTEASWLGTIQALWLDSYGYTRQDCSPTDSQLNIDPTTGLCDAPPTTCTPNGRLDNYCVDQVAETFYDDIAGYSRMRIYESSEPDSFTAYSMTGVVKSYSSGSLVMEPTSMEGNAVYDSGTGQLTITPYTITGTVTSYDSSTGALTFELVSGNWTGPDGESFDLWSAYSSGSAGVWASNDTIALSAGTKSITLNSGGSGIVAGDTITLKTKNAKGTTGETISSWVVECLDPSGAEGTVDSYSIKLSNVDEAITPITTTTGDFSGCSRAILYSYKMNGTEGESYSSWTVSNLTTGLGVGSSSTALQLAESGDISLNVSPTDDWLTEGDSVMVSNYTTEVKDFPEVSYLWNAREELASLDEANLTTNRTNYSDNAANGRWIMTWVDKNLDFSLDSGEFIPFDSTMLRANSGDVHYSFFDVSDSATAENTINYVRGIEVSGTRNRTVQYKDSDSGKTVQRLGDIVNSTPTTVASPAESMDLLYYDYSYRTFKQKYLNRRIMIYAGANDGLLHAFNGGFYEVDDIDLNGDSVNEEYINYKTTSSYNPSATAHPLGAELWAYAPYNLLTHLQWLKDPDYDLTHVSFMDLKPRVFDAKIFPVTGFSTDQSAQLHPNGWGTVMVVGMNLGGGEMTHTVTADTNGDGTDETTSVTTSSAYVVFDITDPESAPVLLGEIILPDHSFTTVYPAVAAFQDLEGNTTCKDSFNDIECNSWYLVFGNGPTDMDNHDTDYNGKLYMFDLNQLTGASPSPATAPADCTIASPAVSPDYNIVECDSGHAGTYMGTPSVVDWELDYKANAAYFGLVGDDDSTKGYVMKYSFNSDATTSQTKLDDWYGLETVLAADNTSNPIAGPVAVQIVPGIDDLDNHWLYFGTGRYFSAPDKLTTASQYLVGLKDPEDYDGVSPNLLPINQANLLNVTDVEMYADGTLVDPIDDVSGTTDALTTFDEIEDDIDDNASGWYIVLPRIIGDSTYPATRNTTRSSLLGGLIVSTVFQPTEDPCAGEGQSRIYASYYKTGTAYPTVPAVLGSDIVTVDGEVKYILKHYLDLGQGLATSPSIHSGQGSGNSGLKIFTQLSTGEMIQSSVQAVESVRTGRTSWSDR